VSPRFAIRVQPETAPRWRESQNSTDGDSKGAPWLKTTLIQCAWAAARKKGSYLQAQFHRLRARRGAKKAIGAVAASMLTAAYHMLKDGTLYHDLGADHFDGSVANARAVCFGV
jgi:transposase